MTAPTPKSKRLPRTPVETMIRAPTLRAIGTLITTASAVDVLVGLQIIRMISPANFMAYHASPVVLGMEFKVKIQILQVLLASQNADPSGKLTKLCDQMRSLYQRRNEVAHAVVGPIASRPDHTNFQMFKAEVKSGNIVRPKPLTAAQIIDWARALYGKGQSLQAAITELHKPYWPPTEGDVVAPRPVAATVPPRTRKRRAQKTKRKTRQSPPQPSEA